MSDIDAELARAVLECPVEIRILLQKVPGPGYLCGWRDWNARTVAWAHRDSINGALLVADAWLPQCLITDDGILLLRQYRAAKARNEQ